MVLVHSAFTHSQAEKQNRENRIKNACLLNSHSNIAASNDKRPLFMQISATPSTSLVSASLPIQCLRPTNFFFCRGIFADNFLRNLLEYVGEVVLIGSERILIGSEVVITTFRTYRNHVPNVSQPRFGRIATTFRTYRNHVPDVSQPRSGRIATTFRTYHNHVRNVSTPTSERYFSPLACDGSCVRRPGRWA